MNRLRGMNKREIVQLVARHAVEEGVTNAPLEGLQLCRMSHPVERILGVYEPSICGYCGAINWGVKPPIYPEPPEINDFTPLPSPCSQCSS